MNETIRRFLSVPAVYFCYHCVGGCGAVPDNLYFHGTLVDEPCTIHPGMKPWNCRSAIFLIKPVRLSADTLKGFPDPALGV